MFRTSTEISYLYTGLNLLNYSQSHLVLLPGWDHPFEEIIDLLMEPEKRDTSEHQTIILHYLFAEKMHKSRFMFSYDFYLFLNYVGYKVLDSVHSNICLQGKGSKS